MSNAVDDALLAKLRAVPNLTVHDGEVPVDTTGKVVKSPMPYVVLYSSIGTDEAEGLCGELSKRTPSVQITYVGRDRWQAKWAGEKAREALSFQTLTVGTDTVQIIPTDSQPVRRDDDKRHEDGSPIIYGSDRYDIPLPF